MSGWPERFSAARERGRFTLGDLVEARGIPRPTLDHVGVYLWKAFRGLVEWGQVEAPHVVEAAEETMREIEARRAK